jgi:hypothetical protein
MGYTLLLGAVWQNYSVKPSAGASGVGELEGLPPHAEIWVSQDATTRVVEAGDHTVILDGEQATDQMIGALASATDPIPVVSGVYRGNAIVLPKRETLVTVLTDRLGSYPIFYCSVSGGTGWCYSSDYRVVRGLVDGEVDVPSLYYFLAKNFSFSHRTVVTGVAQFRPDEIHELDVAFSSPALARSVRRSPWAGWREDRSARQVLPNVVEALRTECARLQGGQLMFSAGWDSRILLGGALAAGVGSNVLCYSHGDTKSREIVIADSICRDHGVPRYTVELSELRINLDLMQECLEASSHCIFPHWRRAAQHARDSGHASLSAGIFGEILGGHFTIPSYAKGKYRKASLVLRYLLLPEPMRQASKDAIIDAAFQLQWRDRYVEWWCFKPEMRLDLRESITTRLKSDFREELERLYSTGADSYESLVEAFQVLHHGRHYSNAQLTSAREVIPVINPFTNPDVLDAALTLSTGKRVNDRFDRQLLKDLAPQLLEYPMAATLVKAKRPILMQEASRALRQQIDKVRWRRYRGPQRDGGKNPNLGWSNFEFVRGTSLLHDVIDSLHSDIWDRPNMHSTVSNHPMTNIHPLYDMLCKIKTADFRMTGRV